MWERACVGAGLLAKAVGQLVDTWLAHRLREQARSHIGLCDTFDSGNPDCRFTGVSRKALAAFPALPAAISS